MEVSSCFISLFWLISSIVIRLRMVVRRLMGRGVVSTSELSCSVLEGGPGGLESSLSASREE
jgi:hypothetical protein